MARTYTLLTDESMFMGKYIIALYNIPTKENPNDSVYKVYTTFKEFINDFGKDVSKVRYCMSRVLHGVSKTICFKGKMYECILVEDEDN